MPDFAVGRMGRNGTVLGFSVSGYLVEDYCSYLWTRGANFRFPISDFRLPIAKCRVPNAEWGIPPVGAPAALTEGSISAATLG